MRIENGVIVFLLLAATVVLAFFVPPFYAAALIPAVGFGAILSGNPRTFLYVYLLIMGIQPLLETNIPFRLVKFTNEFMGLLLFSVFFVQLAFRNLNFRLVKKWIPIAGVLLGYVLLSGVVNRVSPRYALQDIFIYFSFIPFFILSVNYLTRRDLKRILFGTIGFFWINFGLNMGWRWGINPLYNKALAGLGYGSGIIDSAHGTFGGQNHMAYFCAMMFILLFSFKARNVHILGKRYNGLILATLAGLMIQLYFTYTNHAYIYLCLALVPYLLVTGIWKTKRAVAGFVALGFSVAIIFLVSEDFQKMFSKENLSHRQRSFSHGAKAQLFDDLIVKNFRDDMIHWAFGAGPGNGMGPIAKEARSSFALKILLPYYQSGKDYAKQQMSSISGNTSSAILTLWGDFGAVGFFMVLFLYVWVYKKCLQLITRFENRGEMKCLAEAMSGVLAFYLICNITFDELFLSSLCCWVWLLLALLALGDDAKAAAVLNG